ncbi:hypothetical protein ACQ858_08555 [Variovorax ureilyticus]|uniref:DUF7940 domain-containing protein n=1 Tax=Variovorax ureilyticus TaxID=1836198 RepID=UPI003D674586
MNFIAQYFDKVLVPEWRKAWKMLSVIWNSVCAAAAPGWLLLTDDQKTALLTLIGIKPAWIVGAAFLVGIFLRLKAQGINVDSASPGNQ